MKYQPPVGVWKTSPEREIGWAVAQVLLRIERDAPEQRLIGLWEERLRKRLLDPVLDFDWASWYAATIEKADEPPRDIDFAGVPDWIENEFWNAAATFRTTNEGLPFPREAIEAGLREATKLVRSIPESQRDLLRGIMRVALEQGEGQFEFARRIRQEWTGIASWKAKQIAVTEWARAASVATLEAYKAQGETHKVWFNAGDDRVCSVCEANGAEGEVRIAFEYHHGDQQPPAHASCRCNISSA